MIATKMKRADGMAIVLVFDSGVYAVHHGVFLWTIFDADGTPSGSFDAFGGVPHDEVTRGIQGYHSVEPAGRLGRVA